MTATHHTGPVPAPLPAGGPPTPPRGFGWQPAPPPARRSKALPIAVAAAIVLSTAALVVGIVALTRPVPEPPKAPVAAAPTAPAHPTVTTEANHAFCSDIAPLMTESDKAAREFSGVDKSSPEFKAAAESFVTYTKTWVPRMQAVIDSHGDADPFLQRSMQRFVDDQRYIVADLEAGSGAKWLNYDQTAWNDSLAAGSGPLTACFDLGVKW
jgi:hypothetical protein